MTRRDPPPGVSERLRGALQLDALPREGVDMSPRAVTTRLREAADLSTLCLELGVAGARSRARAR